VVRTYTAPVSDTTSAAESTPPTAPTLPRTVNLAIAAICAMVLFSMVRAISMFGYTDQLSRLLKDSNDDAKKPTVPYGPSEIASDLHRVRWNGLWQGLIVAAALLLLAYSLRKTSTASITRWAVLIVMVMTGGPFTVIPAKGLPVVPQVALVLSGLASISAIVLLFLPDSRAYFRAQSAARSGANVAAGMPPRPGLGSLLRSRGVAAPKPQSAQPKPTARQSTAASRAQSRSTKAKVRNDAEAVARGAELARSRAKAASKSRRTES
jgi:hypothetical protein